MSHRYPEFPIVVPQLAEHHAPSQHESVNRIIHLLVEVSGIEGQHDLSLIFKPIEECDRLCNRCGEAPLDEAEHQLKH